VPFGLIDAKVNVYWWKEFLKFSELLQDFGA
jgi:hypothetical protein